jgi:hypothetical protein
MEIRFGPGLTPNPSYSPCAAGSSSLGVVTANKALNASFQGTDKRLVLIDGLHAATAFAFMGAILGGWR